MKKIIILSVLISICAYSQQFPISVFKMYSSVDPGVPSHSVQLQKIFPQIQGASFNYGVPFSHNCSTSQILELLDAANAHNIKIILPNIVEGTNGQGWSGVERFYLDANNDYFSIIGGNPPVYDPDNNAEHPSPFYDHVALRATIANDYMVQGAKYQPVHPWYPGLGYNAWFRLKVSRPSGYDPNAQVAVLEVYDVTTSTVVNSKTLKNSDFTSDNVYQTFCPGAFFSDGWTIGKYSSTSSTNTISSASLQSEMPLDQIMTTTPTLHSFDFRVKWFGGNTTLWLDDIRIDGSYFTGLDVGNVFSGSYDSQIKTAVETYNFKPALARFYLKDEPYITQYLAHHYVNEVLKIADQEKGIDPSTGKGLGYVAKTEIDPLYGTQDPYIRYTQEATPYELATDIYRFYKGQPLPSDAGYTSFAQQTMQTAVDKFKLAQQNSVYAQSKTWQYFPNIGRWPDAYREPCMAEIYAQVNLALAYGAKGIHYFHYWTNDAVGTDFPIGLIDPVTLDPINSKSKYSINHENKWDGIKALNQKLAGSLGTILMQLNWQNAFSIHTQNGSPTGTYITTITSSGISGQDDANQTYIEVGEFTDALNNNYFMLVNRRTINTENRTITVNFNTGGASWEISDVASGNVWVIAPDGNFSDNLSAGEGRLYKISPMPYTATRTIAAGTTMTVAAGSTLTFQTGASLVVNGMLNAVGTSSQPITFTSSSGTSPGSWGSIVLNGSGAHSSTINYANIQYGTEIDVRNASNIIIQNCNITDNSSHGIYYYNSTGAASNNTIANSNIYHGIYIQDGSRVTCNQNVIYKTNQNQQGAGILYSSANGNCGQNDIEYYNWGIAAIWGASPYAMWPYSNMKNNRITNCQYGLMVYRLSYAYFGSSSRNNYMWNSIYNNTKRNAAVGWMYPTYKSGLYACGNWWGNFPPDNSKFYVGSPACFLYHNFPLSSDPWTSGTGILSSVNTFGTSISNATHTPSADSLLDQSDEADSLFIGIGLRGQNKYGEAKKFFMSYLGRHPDNQAAYVELYSCADSETIEDITKYFESLPRQADKDHKLFLSNLYLMQNDKKSAKEVNNNIVHDNLNTSLAVKAKLNNFYIALYNENDPNSASTILKEIEGQASLSTPMELSTAECALKMYVDPNTGNMPNINMEQKNNESAAGPSVQDGFIGNYPNPFNPSTNISYKLSEKGYVTLKIYDVLGKLVTTIVDGQKEAGSYTAKFDGSRCGSGIYFVRLNVNSASGKSYMKTMKIQMIK